MFNRVLFRFVVLILLILYNNNSYGQGTQAIEEGSLIDLEMQKIQEDFTKTDVTNQSIPPSKLIEELNKPGNERLLEQLKNGDFQLKQQAGDSDLKGLKENFDDKNDEDSDEEKKKRLISTQEDEEKLEFSTSDEMYFNREVYFNSIREFYGYKIFLQNPAVNEGKNKVEPYLYSPRNTNHIIGPGDHFVLTLWGDTEFQRQLTVSSEGTVYIDNVGVISVHGLNIEEFEIRLKNLLSRKFRTIDPPGGTPTTFFDVYFDKLNVVNVYVTGEVVSQGPYQVNPNSTILTALISAGGVTSKGTLRNIQLIRNGKTEIIFDVYDYLHTGRNVSDIVLKNGDNIFVGKRLNTIELKGEVYNPLKYELKQNETLADLIKYSGGLLSSSSIDNVTIERLLPIEERTSVVVYSKLINFELASMKNGEIIINPLKLYDRDVVSISSIPRVLTEYVAINGAVYRKGRYGFVEGMTINDLLQKSGGILADAYLPKAELIRVYPDQRIEYKSIDLRTDHLNIELSPLDSINIHSKWSLKSKNVVIINGYINNPGFAYLADSTRVSDLIFSRGGILDEWRKNRTYLLRAELTRFNDDGITTRILNLNLERILDGNKEEDIFLKDGDQLRIFDINLVYSEETVNISGYIKNEGEYKLSTDMTIEDLILKANGFREGAFEYKAIVFRMNTDENSSDLLSKVHEIDLDKDYFKNEKSVKSKFILKNKDHVVIRKSPYFRDLRKVTISGQVKFPGVYSLTSKDETMKNVIDRAGGLTSEAFIDGTVFTRDTLKLVSDFKKSFENDKKHGILLRDGDDIHIPLHPGTVKVEGFVYTPGLIKYRKGWDVGDYIEAAGGEIVELAYKAGDAVIYYPGGDAQLDNNWFFSPEVKEGSRIFVPKIQQTPDRQWRSEIAGWLGVITSTLTVVLLVRAAQN